MKVIANQWRLEQLPECVRVTPPDPDARPIYARAAWNGKYGVSFSKKRFSQAKKHIVDWRWLPEDVCSDVWDFIHGGEDER